MAKEDSLPSACGVDEQRWQVGESEFRDLDRPMLADSLIICDTRVSLARCGVGLFGQVEEVRLWLR